MTWPLPSTDPVVRAVGAWLRAGHVAEDVRLVVACSGGTDSLALAAALVAAAPHRARDAAIVDHGLQRGSARVAATAAATVRGLGYQQVSVLPVTVGRVGGMEAAARRARYAALRSVADAHDPTAAVLLAHTADDQAETVLLGLARGSGPRSIAGMAPWRAPWGRPLLSVRRSDTAHACAAAGIEPWADPQNVDPAFTRVRLRQEVLPLLDEVLGGGVVPALARTAELMADDLEALDRLAEDVLAAAGGVGGAAARLDCGVVAAAPTALRRRVLRRWLTDAGVGELTYEHLVRLDDLAVAGRTGQAVRLPGGGDAVRQARGQLRYLPAAPA